MEEKIKYAPLGMFALAFLKALVISPSWPEVSMLVVLGMASAFFIFFSDEKRFKLMHKRLDGVDTHLTELYKANDNLKGEMSGVKVGQGFKSTTIFGNR